MLTGPFKYLEHIHKVHKKFFRNFKKNKHSQTKEVLSKIKLEYFDKISLFGLIFFQKHPKKLSVGFIKVFKGFERSIYLFFSVKERDHTTHQSNYMSRKMKKVKILKNETQNQIEISLQKLIFWDLKFFQSF